MVSVKAGLEKMKILKPGSNPHGMAISSISTEKALIL
jgi:hypothetical protein